MRTTLDCIPCYLQHAIHIGRMVTDDPALQRRIVQGALERAAEIDFNVPPPAMARELHARIRELTGIADPYRQVKDESTRFAMELLPALRHEVARAADPFETIVRLIIAGNVIDFGTNQELHLDDVHRVIAESLSQPLDHAAVVRLHQAMDQAKSILYLGDNCGEIVFDRLLVERYREKITFAVRGGPILNDATRDDAVASGLAEVVPIIDSGDASPGILLEHSSAEFRDAFAAADLIIAKGQGNYETLNDNPRPIVFLLKAKCRVVAQQLGVELGSLIVIPQNLP
jgi:uncharacterized protein with ATP-grasp and redox domains